MAESRKTNGEEEDEDYMGDLSAFIPPEASQPPKPLPEKISRNRGPSLQPKKKPKTLNWQEQRKREREKKQREEDAQTLAKLDSAIPQSNVGFKMLKMMGYTPGTALGKECAGEGRVEPVGFDIRRSRAGIGREDPHKERMREEEEKMRKEEEKMVKDREKEKELMAEFGYRQKSQWRSRRVVVNYHKAKAALAQLNNEEMAEPKKEDNEECEEEEEQEEEVIREEDLEEILTNLRNEHRYCLFCGFQYESMEALLSNCPGLDEDDH